VNEPGGHNVPTYQYACTECAHAFEQVQSFSDDSLTVCTKCEGRLRKIFAAVGVVFKGSGFYRNDSRSEAKSADAKATDAQSFDTHSSDTQSSDTKTADAKSSDASTSGKSGDSSSGSSESAGSSSSDSGSSSGSASKSKPKAEAGAA
jgi:putative FmdB family regulatory protein